MLCDDCQKRPARVHITQIINHQKKERRLCEECAKGVTEISLSLDSQFSAQDLLKGMLSHSLFGAEMPVKTEASCSQCGMTYSDFNRKGKFGCANCYTVFAPKLETLLRRIHGATHHTGKLPKRSGKLLEVRQQIKTLRQQLEQYVGREEYERAAKLRDEIRVLEKSLQEPQKEEGDQCL